MKDPSRAHSPRLNRNINIILNNYITKYGISVGNVNCLLITDNNHQLNGNEGVI